MRELVQDKDGTLGTKFVPELIPVSKDPVGLILVPDNFTSEGNLRKLQINSPNGTGSAYIDSIPYNCRILPDIEPVGNSEEFGLFLKSDEKASGGYRLGLSPNRQVVQLGNVSMDAVEGLRKIFTLEIILKGDIIDICTGNRRCIVNQCPEQKGKRLWLYIKQGKVDFNNIKIHELIL